MSTPIPEHNSTSWAPTEFHHGNHKDLLGKIRGVPQDDAEVDAIVVPTARPGYYLQEAIKLAASLNCRLVALCSKQASAEEAEQVARNAEIEFLAIDTDRLPISLMPQFTTTQLLAPTVFKKHGDLSLKRNLGLLLARLAGWERIVFLDDDILVPKPDDLSEAASLLGSYDGVGLRIGGFPDNSVVCHAYRCVGGAQGTFVGGGALAVGTTSVDSFFPDIYNEDWFFLLNTVRLRATTMVGSVEQDPYDPFANETRAQDEEFGDTLAEGVYWLLDHGRRVRDADLRFWQEYLYKRRQFIKKIITRIGNDVAERDRMVAALEAALERSKLIDPQLCVDFLRAWRSDRTRWRKHIEGLYEMYGRTEQPLDKLLSDLGLWDCCAYNQLEVAGDGNPPSIFSPADVDSYQG